MAAKLSILLLFAQLVLGDVRRLAYGSNGISESSSGHLFTMKPEREFNGPRRFDGPFPNAELVARSKGERITCAKWAVTTTIFAPSKAVVQAANLDSSWCLVVVGDKKSPSVYNINSKNGNSTYLSPAAQEKLPFETLKLLKWNHFGRKNVGFLYAIMHGAHAVYDFDDDNELLRESTHDAIPLPSTRSSAPVEEPDTSHWLYNLYGQLANNTNAWPRGFPLEAVHDEATRSSQFVHRGCTVKDVVVFQSLADHDPDVDGIYRLTQPLPMYFDPVKFPSVVKAPQGHLNLNRHFAMPIGTMMPYNAQATLLRHSALWSLLLPCSVHGRVTDIWRSFIAQRLLWDIGLRVAFSTPWVTQHRNAHNYLADLSSEIPLYERAGVLVKALREWQPATKTLPGRIEELYVFLYENAILELSDVWLAQAWISDLHRVGYNFPTLADSQWKYSNSK